MQNEKIITIRWQEVNGEKFSGHVRRDDFYLLMSKFARDYFGNNEISSEILSHPNICEIYIDEKLNSTKDIPYIQYRVEGDSDDFGVIKARRNNKIIWTIFSLMKSLVKTAN